MKVKKLKWKNNATSFGKKLGLFAIITDSDILNLTYSISNENISKNDKKFYTYIGERIDDGYTQTTPIENCFNTIEEAKQHIKFEYEKRLKDKLKEILILTKKDLNCFITSSRKEKIKKILK